ncbi:MAG: hypothetical protein EOM22_00305 [Gammaproteobacteria bacterium]|nr:hypothetical protein [Gammaproteobacteria bacterium]
MILILPFFLLLILLAFNSTRLLVVKQHVLVEARTTAWRSAFFADPWGETRCVTSPGALIDGQPIWTDCTTSSADGSALLSRLEKDDHARGMLDAFREQAGAKSLPQRVEVTAYSLFSPSHGLGWPLTVQATHAVDAQRVWERVDAPLGYDRYLDEVIDSDNIFSAFFPGLR